MKRKFAYVLYLLCLGLLTEVFASVPVFAHSSCPTPRQMLRSVNDTAWNKGSCVQQFSQYIRSLDEDTRNTLASNRDNIMVLRVVSSKLKERITHLRRTEGQSKKWEYWYKIYNEFAHSFGERNEKLVWNGSNYVLEKVERQISNQLGPEILPGWPEKVVRADITSKQTDPQLKRLLGRMIKAVEQKEDLTPFIELLAQSDPAYVSQDVVNMGFLMYAYNIAPSQQEKLLKYLKGTPRVRYAVAAAAAEFSADYVTRGGSHVANIPAGRLKLNEADRFQIASILIDADKALGKNTPAQEELHNLALYRVGRLYEDPREVFKRVEGSQSSTMGWIVGSGIATMLLNPQSVLATSTGVTGVAVAGEGTLAAVAAPAGITVSFLLITGYALQNAYAPGLRAANMTALENALATRYESIATTTQQAQAVNIEDVIADIVDATTISQVEATRQQFNQCVYNPAISTPGAPANEDEWERFVIKHAGGDVQWNRVKDCVIRQKAAWCVDDRNALLKIYAQRSSFTAQVPGVGTVPLSVHAVYLDGRWKATVELAAFGRGRTLDEMLQFALSLFLDPVTLGRVDEYMEKFKEYNPSQKKYGFKPNKPGWRREIAPGKSMRNGVDGHGGNKFKPDYEKPFPHFHVEQRCHYTPNTGTTPQVCSLTKGRGTGTEEYICNLSLKYKETL